MSDRDELVARLVAATKERERALLEDEIWDKTPPNERGKYGKAYILMRTLHPAGIKAKMRLAMVRRGAEVDALWDRVDGPDGITMTTAHRIFKKADKRSKEKGIPLRDAIAYLLINPAKITKKHANGHGQANEAGELFARRIKEAARDYILGGEFGGLGAPEAAKMAREFVAEIAQVVADARGRHRRAKAKYEGLEEAAHPVVGRPRVIRACELLGLAVPKPRAPVDERVLKRRHREHVRLYHPDHNPGQEGTMRRMLEDANDARTLLEEYNEQLARHKGKEGEAHG